MTIPYWRLSAKVWQTFPVKSQRINTLGFTGHKACHNHGILFKSSHKLHTHEWIWLCSRKTIYEHWNLNFIHLKKKKDKYENCFLACGAYKSRHLAKFGSQAIGPIPVLCYAIWGGEQHKLNSISDPSSSFSNKGTVSRFPVFLPFNCFERALSKDLINKNSRWKQAKGQRKCANVNVSNWSTLYYN